MNLTLLISLVLFLDLTLLDWFLPYITPRSIQFGVRIPRERESDPVIFSTRQSYHFRLMAGSILIFAAFYLAPAFAGLYSLTLLSVIFELFFEHINYYFSFRKLHRIKVKRAWFDGLTESYGVLYFNETSVRHKLTGAYFIFPALLFFGTDLIISISAFMYLPSSIPTHFSFNGTPTEFSPKSFYNVFLIVLIQGVITSALFIAGWVLSRTSMEIDVSRPYTTFEQQSRFKSLYRDMLYVFASLLGMTILFEAMRRLDYPAFEISTTFIALPLALGYLLFLSTPYFLGQMGTRLSVPGDETEDTGISNVDDDRQWKLGIFNYNRQDPSILVGRRFGFGWTFNLGNPRSWIILGVIILIVAAIVFNFLLR